jgi:VWFA-related protein
MALAITLFALLQAPPSPPTIPVEAEIVHVEAIVTDKKDRPVRGLRAADFVVYEDGRPVPIVAFAAPPTEVASSPERPSAPAADVRSPVPLDTTTIVVYVDNRNLTSGGRHRVLDGLEAALETQLAMGRVRVLVVADQRGSRALGEVASDPKKLGAALAAAAEGVTEGNLARSEERATLDLVAEAVTQAELAGLTCADAMPQAVGIVRQYAQGRVVHLQDTFARLADLTAAVSALPGTKALLFLTENLEQYPGLALFHQLGDFCPEAAQNRPSDLYAPAQEFDLSRALRELAARASAARVTIYPIDGAGLTTHSIADASQPGRRFTPSPGNDLVRAANVRAGPQILAEYTGGVPLFGSNQPARALKWISDDLRARYSLGFKPAREPDGRSHSLSVEVARKGLRVRHRLSYFHSRSGDLQVKSTYAALLLGYEEDELGATIEVAGDASPAPSEAAIRISLPLDHLGMRAEADNRVAQLRVTMVVRSAGGVATEILPIGREQMFELQLPPTAAKGDPKTHDIVVRIPFGKQEQEIAVGVRDVVGGAATYKRLLVRP